MFLLLGYIHLVKKIMMVSISNLEKLLIYSMAIQAMAKNDAIICT